MWQPRRSLSKTSNRIAGRKFEEAQNKAHIKRHAMDPNVTLWPGCVGRQPAQGLAAPAVPASALHEANMPEWNPTSSASDGGYTDREDRNRPMSSISLVTETTGSEARSRSPTIRMIDLKAAEKPVSSKTVKLPADVPDDVRKLFKEIQSLARIPRGVIPVGIEVRSYSRPSSPFAHSSTRTKLKSMLVGILTIWTYLWQQNRAA